MGEVTGPISTLPGHSHQVPDGTVCDDHPDRPAVARIQGETDSFGAELMGHVPGVPGRASSSEMREADHSGTL
jgi:hypothetical protein